MTDKPAIIEREIRGMSITYFSRMYGIGRTLAYEEIKAGRLICRKIGRRTLISRDDAENWLRGLANSATCLETTLPTASREQRPAKAD